MTQTLKIPSMNLRRLIRNNLINFLVLTLSILVAFISAEVAVRIHDNQYLLKNFSADTINLFRSEMPTEYDVHLGWIPRASLSDDANIRTSQVTILQHGIRSNGNYSGAKQAQSDPPILAVGDSYTYGVEVSDNETWPAALESSLGRKVINGGVFGYGLDQTYLRTIQLIEIYKPEILILSVIADDINRCQLSMRSGVQKPYFDVSEGELVLKNVPVTPPSAYRMDLFRKILGYSYLAHKIMMKKSPNYWIQGLWYSRKAHRNEEQVACLLVREFGKLIKTNKVKDIFLVIQYGFNGDQDTNGMEMIERLIPCAKGTGVHVVDLADAIFKVKKSDAEEYRSLHSLHHLSPKGNYFVASLIKDVITSEMSKF